MPLKGVKYRVKKSKKGNVRLAFDKNGNVVEAKNLKTGDTHTPAMFKADKKRSKKRTTPKKRSGR